MLHVLTFHCAFPHEWMLQEKHWESKPEEEVEPNSVPPHCFPKWEGSLCRGRWPPLQRDGGCKERQQGNDAL